MMDQSIAKSKTMLVCLHVPNVGISSIPSLLLSRPGPATLSSFYLVRPVVETGWEVMLINRALQEGEYSADTILKDYTVRPFLSPSLSPYLFTSFYPSMSVFVNVPIGDLTLPFLIFPSLPLHPPSLPALPLGLPPRVPDEGIRRSHPRSVH